MSTDTITPTAIDAFVAIEFVKVVGRHRRDLGDVTSLAASIKDIGLLHPVVLTRDGQLVAGQRRLEACRLIGVETVPVRFVDNLDDATRLLHAERDENVCRKDMLPSELASLGAALLGIERQAAKERQRSHNGTAPGRSANTPGTRTTSDSTDRGLAVDAVGEALGMSGRTYQELKYTHELANDGDPSERDLAQAALSAMDDGAGIAGEARRLRAKVNARRDTGEATPADPDWTPEPNDKSRAAAIQRRNLIRRLAPLGYSSDQIGERLGILAQTIRRLAREENVTVPADEVMGHVRRSIDSNRIIRETVQELADAEIALNLVDYDDLDRDEVANWTASLTASIRVLNRLNKRLKEMVQ